MAANMRAKNKIMMSRGDKMFEVCPACGGDLNHMRQVVGYDRANPARYCRTCDTAWIWRIYG